MNQTIESSWPFLLLYRREPHSEKFLTRITELLGPSSIGVGDFPVDDEMRAGWVSRAVSNHMRGLLGSWEFSYTRHVGAKQLLFRLPILIDLYPAELRLGEHAFSIPFARSEPLHWIGIHAHVTPSDRDGREFFRQYCKRACNAIEPDVAFGGVMSWPSFISQQQPEQSAWPLFICKKSLVLAEIPRSTTLKIETIGPELVWIESADDAFSPVLGGTPWVPESVLKSRPSPHM